VCPRPRDCDEASAWHRYIADRVDADQSGGERNNLRSRRREDIYGARIRVRMRTLHVNDTLVFGGFEFGQMGMYRRRFSKVRVHVEKRRVKDREKKRRYCATGRQFSHGAILMNWSLEVNGSIELKRNFLESGRER
jgi:hypothetical protein